MSTLESGRKSVKNNLILRGSEYVKLLSNQSIRDELDRFLIALVEEIVTMTDRLGKLMGFDPTKSFNTPEAKKIMARRHRRVKRIMKKVSAEALPYAEMVKRLVEEPHNHV